MLEFENPAMQPGIKFAGKSFEGPFELGTWTPAARAGVYCVMVPDSGCVPSKYRAIYFGETGNFAERAFPSAKNGQAGWLKIADYSQVVHIAAYWMARSTADERKAVERELIQLYEPECNEILRGHSLLPQ
jgi:hypothetical protein